MHGRGGIKDSLAFGMMLTIAAENGRRIRGAARDFVSTDPGLSGHARNARCGYQPPRVGARTHTRGSGGGSARGTVDRTRTSHVASNGKHLLPLGTKDQDEHEQHVVLHGHALVERLHHKARQLNSTASKTDLLGLTVHACIDGVGIMTGLVQAAGTSLLILCAVLLHKLPWGAVSPASCSHLDRTCIQRQ